MEFLRPAKTDVDYKLIVLLALDSIGSLTKYELNSILVEGEYSDYMSTTLALNDLLYENSVRLDDIYYSITEKGKEQLNLFEDRIPVSIKSSFLINAMEYKKQLVKDRDVQISFNNLKDNKVQILLYIYENKYQVMKIDFITDREKVNYNCINKIKRNFKKIYESFLGIAYLSKIYENRFIDDANSSVEYIDNLPYVVLEYKSLCEICKINLLTPSPETMEKISTAWKYCASEKIHDIYKYFFSK